MPNATVEKVRSTLSRPLWSGGRTLTLGELICFVLAIALWHFRFLGKWSVHVALGILLLAAIIW